MQLAAAVMGVGNADGISAVTAGAAMMLALAARDRGAGGQHLLTSMLSSVSHCISEATIEYEGRPGPPTADSDLYGFGALYRLYGAAEEWVFLAAPSQREMDGVDGQPASRPALGGRPEVFQRRGARAQRCGAGRGVGDNLQDRAGHCVGAEIMRR